MTYRKKYWKDFKHQLWLAFYVLWHGVIRDEGHHSQWGKTWFFMRDKK